MNLLVLQTDQQRYDSLGCTGNPFAITPNLDAFGRSGTVFSRHIATNPSCMPSRASFATGLTPLAHGVWSGGVSLPREEYHRVDPESRKIFERVFDRGLFPPRETLADMLGQRGYQTAALGKLHFTAKLADPSHGFEESTSMWADDSLADWTGPYYGYQYVQLILGHGEKACDHNAGHYARWLEREHPDVVAEVRSGAAREARPFPGQKGLYLSRVPAQLHNTSWLADRACDYLEERAESQPFFLHVSFPDPHHPYTPPADLLDELGLPDVPAPAPRGDAFHKKPAAVQRALTARDFQSKPGVTRTAAQHVALANALVDRAVGRILTALDEAGLAEDTVVLFTSDHGEFLGDYGTLFKQFVAARPLVHVPFLLRAPGHDLARLADVPMSNADVVPTMLGLLGEPIPTGLQGVDLLTADTEQHTPMVVNYAARDEETSFSVFDRDHRYTFFPRTGDEELYDHRADPFELDNLAFEPSADAHERCVELRRRTLELHARYDVPSHGRIAAW